MQDAVSPVLAMPRAEPAAHRPPPHAATAQVSAAFLAQLRFSPYLIPPSEKHNNGPHAQPAPPSGNPVLHTNLVEAGFRLQMLVLGWLFQP